MKVLTEQLEQLLHRRLQMPLYDAAAQRIESVQYGGLRDPLFWELDSQVSDEIYTPLVRGLDKGDQRKRTL